MTAPDWRIARGDDAIVATAIHAGHELRPEVAALMKLSDDDRLREEDPFTDRWVGVAKNSIIVDKSRFEVDLNRPRDGAVYVVPDDAWGLDIWNTRPSDELIERSLEIYDRFYSDLAQMCDELVETHGHVLVLDIHSYNHRRGGPDAPVDDPGINPEVNLGTVSIEGSWSEVVAGFKQTMCETPFYDSVLDVRENVKFKGGAMTRWINDRYGDRGVSIAVEMKKIFMDEWTGVPDEGMSVSIGRILETAAETARGALSERT